MYFFLIIFSAVGIVFLIVSKSIEIRTGKVSWFGNKSVSYDPIVRRKLGTTKVFVSRINSIGTKNFLIARVQNLFQVFGMTGLFVSRYYGKIKSRIKGRKVLKGGGVVSFFLKDVAESKSEEDDRKL